MSNRFEKKSKLTLFIILAISLFIMLIVFEKLVGITLNYDQSETRHIRLRENTPNLDLKLTPTSAELNHSDSLVEKAYTFVTDSDGFIVPSNTPSNNNNDSNNKTSLKIAFIGGSTTENMYVDETKRFPYLSAEILGQTHNSSSQKITAINAGVSGNDSLNSINAYLNKLVPQRPKVAVLMHNINDVSTLLHEGSYWNRNEYRSPIIYEDRSLKSFIKFSFPNIFELLYRVKTSLTGPIDEFSEDRGKSKTIDNERFYRLFEENLQIFVSISKAKGITPVLMTQASRFTEKPDPVIVENFKALASHNIDYADFKRLYDDMNESIRKVAEQNQVMLIDLAQQVPATKEFIVDTVHFSNEGSELAAKIISEQLTSIIEE